jgi:segregation and condensation protein A
MSASPDSLPRVESDEFAGPLDLLLDEVRRQRVAIESIAMAPVVARYLEYVRGAAARNLNLHIDWLDMAATLIQWKSQSLLPIPAQEERGVDPIREDLVRQLLAHRRQAAEELERRQAIEQKRVTRVAGGEDWEEAPSEFVSVWELIQQAREMARWVEAQRQRREPGVAFVVEPDDASVAEMIEFLRAQLAAEDPPVEGLSILRSVRSPSRRSCLFLGILEMARSRQLEIEQNVAFGPIHLRLVRHGHSSQYQDDYSPYSKLS